MASGSNLLWSRTRILAKRQEVLAIAIIVALAIVTRLYQIGSFPYFPVAPPWLGVGGQFQGFYIDEAVYVGVAGLYPSLTSPFSAYQPPLQLAVVKLSMLIFGNNDFAARLPSGVASVLTTVVVYLAAKQLFKGRAPAFFAALFFVVMVPAIIYGRMLLLENFVALFLSLTIFSIAKFEDGAERRWLYLGAITSVLAVLSKIDGLFVPAFFIFWAITRDGRSQKIGPMLIVLFPTLAGIFGLLSLKGSFSALLSQWWFANIGRELSIEYLFIQSMPSGYVVFNIAYIKPEFWYIFGFACLAALIVKGVGGSRLLTEVLFVFVVTELAEWGLGSYYLTMVFPVIALAAGGGFLSLARLGNTGALALYTALYVTLVSSYIASSTLGDIAFNYTLFIVKDALFVAPIAIWLALDGVFRVKFKKRFPFAPVVLVSFFTLLLVATPALYSYYFLGSAP